MKDEDKTKEQLINELVEMRQLISKLKCSETSRKQVEETLHENETQYKEFAYSLPQVVFEIDLTGKITFTNLSAFKAFGYAKDDFDKGLNALQMIIPEDRDSAKTNIYRVFQGEDISGIEYTALRKDGSTFPIIIHSTPITYEGRPVGLRGVIIDITERKRVEEALRESENKYRTIFETTGTATVIIEENSIISLVNTEVEKLSGYSKEELEGKKSWVEFVVQDDLERLKEYFRMRKIDSNSVPNNCEFRFINKQGNIKNILANTSIIPGTKKTVVSLLDITKRKQAEERLQYLSLRDPLTNLYNRTYFKQEMHRLNSERYYPVGIIVCDIDGLKLINDTIGHNAGDNLLVAAAKVIRKSFRKSDIVSRIGGDEFTVLLPNSDWRTMVSAVHRLRDTVKNYNAQNPKFPLSISVGFAVSTVATQNLNDLFKEADNNMYREKLCHSQSSRSTIIKLLMKALETRDFITEGHADRLQDLVVNMAMAIGLPEYRIINLRLFAQFHDIGKVGISDHILFKPGPLTPEEFSEMQRHCEIGYRIAQSAPDLVFIADWILKHHEWWNGKGYPIGLKGEEIPMACRILSIADAYDAMTSDRPYRKAMSHKEAVMELRKRAGIQFDPHLVYKFIKILSRRDPINT